jgi:hypothetical protein
MMKLLMSKAQLFPELCDKLYALGVLILGIKPPLPSEEEIRWISELFLVL